MTRLDDPWTVAAGIFVMIMSIVMLIVLLRMNRLMKHIDEIPAQRRQRATRWMLIAQGIYMVSIGLLIITFGDAGNSVAVIGMGILIIIGAAHGVLTGELWQRSRPGRD